MAEFSIIKLLEKMKLLLFYDIKMTPPTENLASFYKN